MKRTLSFKIIVLLLAAVMLCPAAALAELKSAFGAKQGEPVGVNSLGAVVRGDEEPELTELDLALNAEGGSLHFETGGEFPAEVSGWDEPVAVTDVYGQRTVAKAQADSEEIVYNLAGVSMIWYEGSTVGYNEYMSLNLSDFERYALGSGYIDGDLRWTVLPIENTGEIPWTTCYTAYIDGFNTSSVINGNYGKDEDTTSVSAFSTYISGMTAGEIMSFHYAEFCRPNVDHFRFYANGELVFEHSQNGVAGTYEFTCPADGDYTFTWEYYRGEYDLTALSSISTKIEAQEGEALAWDWVNNTGNGSAYSGLDYSLYVNDKLVLSTVKFLGTFIQCDTFVFPQTGTYRVEWRATAAPQWNHPWDYPELTFTSIGSLQIMLDEVRIISAAEADSGSAALSGAVGPNESEIKLYSEGRLKFIAGEYNGEPAAKVGTEGAAPAAELTNYAAKLYTTVYMKRGWSLSYRWQKPLGGLTDSWCYVYGPMEHFEVVRFGNVTGGILDATDWFEAPAEGNYTFVFFAMNRYSDTDSVLDNLFLSEVSVRSTDQAFDPYLSAALNAEGSDIRFWSPGYAYTSSHYGNQPDIDYAATIFGGRYVGVNTSQGEFGWVDNEFPSSVRADVYMSAGSELRFDYKLSTEEYDRFEFWVNEELQSASMADREYTRYRGSLGWDTYAWTAPEDGTYNLRWTYIKDSNGARGYDSVWLDNVELVGVIPENGAGEQGKSVQPAELSALAQTMNAPGCTLDYTNNSHYPWVAAEYNGETVGKSNHTDIHDDMDSSYVTASVSMTAGDELSFDYLVSSEEECDGFKFYVNDAELFFDSGVKDWQSYTYTAEAGGSYTFKWEYMRDDGDWDGDDCVYVKNVDLSAASVELSELAQAMNAAGCIIDYTNDSAYPWVVDEYNGEPVGRSNHTDIHDDMDSSYVTASVSMTAGDELSFDYLVSSEEDCDGFKFYVNDEELFFDSGVKDWQSYTYTAEAGGSYTFKWEYMRDDGDWDGDDCVYVKNVWFSGDMNAEPVIYPADLADAISAGIGVLFATDSQIGWHAGEGCAVSGGADGSWTETRLFIDINNTIIFNYALTGGTLKACLIDAAGNETVILMANNACDFTELRRENTEWGVYTVRFEHTGEGEASIKDFTLIQAKSQAKPASQEQLDAALNAEGGELTFSTWGNYPMYVGTLNGKTFAGNTNNGVDATESGVRMTAYLEAGQVLAYDYVHRGGDDYYLGNNDYAVMFVTYENGHTEKVSIAQVTTVDPNSFVSTAWLARESGTYTFTWAYYKDRNEGMCADVFRLDNVRIINEVSPEYDGRLYGTAADGVLYGYDTGADTAEEIRNCWNYQLMPAMEYVPERKAVYGFAYYDGMAVACMYTADELVSIDINFISYGNTIPLDMTYNRVNETLYLLAIRTKIDPDQAHLFRVNLDNNMSITDLGALTGLMVDDYAMTLASDNEGNIYCTDMSGVLYTVNADTLECTFVGLTGLSNAAHAFQSMTYDGVAETMYLSYIGTDNTNGGIYTVDLDTGAATLVMDNVGQVTSLFTYTPADIIPTGLMGDVDCDGELTFSDVGLLYQYLIGDVQITAMGKRNADMSGDGDVTFADVSALYDLLVGGTAG